jgi:glutathione S-transferase
VDELCQFIIQDCRDRVIVPSMRETDEAKKAAMRAEIAAKLLPEKLAMLEAQIGPSGYLVGEGITLADLQFYVMANWVGMGAVAARALRGPTDAARLHTLAQSRPRHACAPRRLSPPRRLARRHPRRHPEGRHPAVPQADRARAHA